MRSESEKTNTGTVKNFTCIGLIFSALFAPPWLRPPFLISGGFATKLERKGPWDLFSFSGKRTRGQGGGHCCGRGSLAC